MLRLVKNLTFWGFYLVDSIFFRTFALQLKQKGDKDMAKEEVTLREKFTTWRVLRRVGNTKKVKETIETSPKPMTPSEALKHFKVNAISAVIE